ncbi:MAG: hypothetical protein KBE65_18090 [Phycisphaerae bacterium]|nr:hypothetical protein [Phycisphaerae bacterium]
MRATRGFQGIVGVSLALTIASATMAKYGGGTGEPNDPYQIATATDLITLGETPKDYGKHFILTADIDLDPNLPGGKIFDRAVIASITNAIEGGIRTTRFSGVFDGDGHTISNFTCHVTDEMETEIGLFGWADDPGVELRNLRLIHPQVYGDHTFSAGSLVGFVAGTVRNCSVEGGSITSRTGYVGGLVGYNRSSLIACYSTTTVVGGTGVGGLVGGNYGRIIHCYSTGMVSGQRDVGGLTGYNANRIMDCYSGGSVEGDEGVGGFLGRTMGSGRSGGSVEINCFWHMEASGQTSSAGGTGLTTTELEDPNILIAAGWDFVGQADGPHDIWAEPLDGRRYPVLHWQLPAGFGLPQFSGGTGEPNDPYLISSPEDWNCIGHNPRLMGAHFRLTNDIDLAKAESFAIANEYYPFTGVFEGGGHTVANFTYGPARHNCVGLFEYVCGPNARVEMLGAIDPNIQMDHGYGVGSLAGNLGEGVIRACFARGGSIAGGGIHVGGLVGSSYGVISDCYTDGISVTGRGYVAGLVGLTDSPAMVVNCYSSSAVFGDSFLGGFVARGPRKCVRFCFWDMLTSGQTTSPGGGTGRKPAEMQTAKTFLDTGWDFVGETVNGTGDVWWIEEGNDYPRLWWELNSEASP